MPIVLLWNETAGGSLAQFGRWFDSLGHLSRSLGLWLAARLREAERVERLTAAFPVFRFYDGAVTARIAGLQQGVLLDAPVPGLGAHLERAVESWRLDRTVDRAVREARLLPELLRVLQEITGGVLASIDRFRTPAAAMFDPRARSAADLPGLAALAFRAVATSRGGILTAAKSVRRAIQGPPGASAAAEKPVAGAPATPAPAEAAALPLVFRIDELARWVVAGLLILPALGRLLPVVGGDLLVHLRYLLLEVLEGIEAKAFRVRRTILDVFRVDLVDAARFGLRFVLAARETILGTVSYYSLIGVAFLRGVGAGLTRLANDFASFWEGLTSVVQQVLQYGNALIRVDVGPIVHNALVAVEEAIETIDTHFYSIGDSPEMYDAPAQRSVVTVGDLVLGTGTGATAIAELTRATELLRRAWYGAEAPLWNAALVGFFAGISVPRTIHALQQITGALNLPRAGAAAPPPRLVLSDFPDLVTEVVEPLRTGLGTAIEGAFTAVSTGVGDMLTRLRITLGSVGDAFDRAAAHASRMGSLALLRRLTGSADELLTALYGEESPAGEEAEAAAETGLEPLAGAYAQWLIQGGFDTVGAALAGYVGMMVDEWARHVAEGRDLPFEVTPTSPRHLLERARLGRVHAPEMRIVVRRRELGRPLAREIAGRFRGAVQDAYGTGQLALAGRLKEAAP